MSPRLRNLLSLFVGFGLISAACGVEAEVVRFETLDGVKIVADYSATDGEEPAPVVILLHMYRSNRAAWEPLVSVLHRAELAVLAIDLRGHGENVEPADKNLADKSTSGDSELFNSMHSDVQAAYYWLSRRSNVDLTRASPWSGPAWGVAWRVAHGFSRGGHEFRNRVRVRHL